MCLPYNFVKSTLIPSTIAIMVLGIIPLLSVVVMHHKNELFESYEYALIGAFSNFVILLILGLFGFIGYYQKKQCMIGCYLGCLGLITALLVIGSIALTYFVQFIGNIKCDEYNTEFISELIQVTTSAEQLFCTIDCECQVNNTNLNSTYLDDNGIYYFDESEGAINYQSCPNQFSSEYTNSMRQLEEKYGCSGWCERYPVYLFSNINNGIPSSDGCYLYYRKYVKYYSLKTAFSYYTIALFTIIIEVFACCFCCHPNRNQGTKRMYPYIKYELAA